MKILSKIKPINGADFKIADAEDIAINNSNVKDEVNGLKNKTNHLVSVSNFGAVGDGVTDDTIAIQKALDSKGSRNLYFPKGTYLCSKTLYFPSGTYIGENETIIVANSFENEHFIKNKNSSLNGDRIDTLNFINLTFKMGANGGQMNGVLLGLFNTINSSVINCSFISDANNTHNVWGVDLYTNNSNCLISNCYFNLKAINSALTTSISIREFCANKITEDITVRDCYITEEGQDELLWVSEFNGSLKNILLDNLTLIDNGDTQSIAFLGGGENVTLQNSKIETKSLNGRLLTFDNEGKTGKQFINVLNCHFKVDSLKSTSTIIQSSNAINGNNINVKNCIIELLNANNLNCDCINAICNSYNNTIIGKYYTILRQVLQSVNDNLLNASGTLRDVQLIDNIKYNSPSDYFISEYKFNSDKDLKIINSDISCKQLIQYVDPQKGQKIEINNCNITKTEWQLIVSTSTNNIEGFKIDLINTNINSDDTFRFVDKDYLIINPVNILKNNKPLSGYPDNQIDLQAVQVGSVFRSNDNTKMFIKKIKEGNTKDCWIEI